MLFGFISLTVFCKECTNYENSKYLSFPVGQLRHNVLISVFSNGCSQYTVDCVYTLVCRDGAMNVTAVRELVDLLATYVRGLELV
jgi:hypothetical protein